MTTSPTESDVGRRTVLRGAAGAATAGLGLNAATIADAQESASSPYGGWFSNTSNFDGTVDRTGQENVRITVGAEGNNGNFAFGPAAVQVDPGTTVVWEWSGNGSLHNVVAEDGSFESETTDEKGHTFEQTFEESGVVKYACSPHEPMGMKGAVVVGDASAGGATAGGSSSESALPALLAIGGGVGLVGVLFGMFAAGARSGTRRNRTDAGR